MNDTAFRNVILEAWLRERGAKLIDTMITRRNADGTGRVMIERYYINAIPVIFEIYDDGGWSVFLPGDVGNSVSSTLAFLDERLETQPTKSFIAKIWGIDGKNIGTAFNGDAILEESSRRFSDRADAEIYLQDKILLNGKDRADGEIEESPLEPEIIRKDGTLWSRMPEATRHARTETESLRTERGA